MYMHADDILILNQDHSQLLSECKPIILDPGPESKPKPFGPWSKSRCIPMYTNCYPIKCYSIPIVIDSQLNMRPRPRPMPSIHIQDLDNVYACRINICPDQEPRPRLVQHLLSEYRSEIKTRTQRPVDPFEDWYVYTYHYN